MQLPYSLTPQEWRGHTTAIEYFFDVVADELAKFSAPDLMQSAPLFSVCALVRYGDFLTHWVYTQFKRVSS